MPNNTIPIDIYIARLVLLAATETKKSENCMFSFTQCLTHDFFSSCRKTTQPMAPVHLFYILQYKTDARGLRKELNVIHTTETKHHYSSHNCTLTSRPHSFLAKTIQKTSSRLWLCQSNKASKTRTQKHILHPPGVCRSKNTKAFCFPFLSNATTML